VNGAQVQTRAAGAAPEQIRRAGGVAPALRALVERTVQGLGYELVDVERAGGGLLRVTLDRETGGGIGIGDCERVSRQLTHLFAVEAVDYGRLEVSSPGLDRPLRSARDFARFSGSLVRIGLKQPLDGRKRLRGRLIGISGEAGQERVQLVPIADAGQASAARGRARRAGPAEAAPVEFALADVEKARLAPEWEFKRSGDGRR
jgi:ribosome maturation factor RimP